MVSSEKFREKQTGVVIADRVWKSGKPAFGFPLFHRGPPPLWECGNLALCARFPRGCGKRGKPAFGFPRFPQPRHFHSGLLVIIPLASRSGTGPEVHIWPFASAAPPRYHSSAWLAAPTFAPGCQASSIAPSCSAIAAFHTASDNPQRGTHGGVGRALPSSRWQTRTAGGSSSRGSNTPCKTFEMPPRARFLSHHIRCASEPPRHSCPPPAHCRRSCRHAIW